MNGDSMQFKRMIKSHMSNAKSSVTEFVTMSPVVTCEILTLVWTLICFESPIIWGLKIWYPPASVYVVWSDV